MNIDPRKSWFVGDDPVADIWGPSQLGFNTAWVERHRPWPNDLNRCFTQHFTRISEVMNVLSGNHVVEPGSEINVHQKK